MAKRYCGPCDEIVTGRECPKCGADTDKIDAVTAALIMAQRMADAARLMRNGDING